MMRATTKAGRGERRERGGLVCISSLCSFCILVGVGSGVFDLLHDTFLTCAMHWDRIIHRIGPDRTERTRKKRKKSGTAPFASKSHFKRHSRGSLYRAALGAQEGNQKNRDDDDPSRFEGGWLPELSVVGHGTSDCTVNRL